MKAKRVPEVHLRATCDGCRVVTCRPPDLTRAAVRTHEKLGCGPIRLEEVFH